MTFTASRLEELTHIQDKNSGSCGDLNSETGTLAYATCTVLQSENEGPRGCISLHVNPGEAGFFTTI